MSDGEHYLDAKGLGCPLPILHTRKKLKTVPAGEVLVIEATDPGSVADLQSFCRQTGNEMVEHSVDGDVFRFKIRHTG